MGNVSVMLIGALAPLPPLPTQWQRVPLVTAEQRRAGHLGGEGGQWPRAMTSSADGKTLYLGIDVAGLYKSVDGGKSWALRTVGYSPRGCVALAVDPHFPDRVIAIGGNSAPGGHHGAYLTTDGAASWRATFPVEMAGLGEVRDQLVFDPRTKGTDRTRVAYWSRVRDDKAHWGTPPQHPAIYKTEDGGESWMEIPGSTEYGGGILRIHGATGTLYTSSATGLWESTDEAKTWRKIADGNVSGVDVAPDGTLAYNTDDAVFVRYSKGGTFQRKTVADPGGPLRNVKISPVDPRRMVLWTEGRNWDWRRYATEDGGDTWTRATKDASRAFLPDNARQGIFVWDPKNARKVMSLGGDWPTMSTDGGKTYRYSAEGENCLLVGGAFQFNAQNPDLLFIGSQDYNGASTTDGGQTWTYRNPSGNGWGGFTYGGYALSKDVLYVGNAGGWGDPRALTVSRDGGRTWTPTGMKMEGGDCSMGVPGKPKIAFAANLRTTDGGLTWAPMAGVSSVLCAAGGRLYGSRKLGEGQGAVIVSSDAGATWNELARLDREVMDVAASPDGRTVLVASMDLFRIEDGKAVLVETPKDQFGGRTHRSVAMDPRDPRVVYLGGCANVYSASNALSRSIDGGKTWKVLTHNAPLKAGQLDGGRETFWVRVHPKTGEAWCATSCYGLWKYGNTPKVAPKPVKKRAN